MTGPTARANLEGIQAIINRAEGWERRSGATFEGDKTALIHFTRTPSRQNTDLVLVKGQEVKPTTSTKIFGVIMDSELRFRQHIARASTRGLAAAMALRRLRYLSPSTARRLFEATVAPVVDYASCIWMHRCTGLSCSALKRVQRVGAQAVTGCFKTVATAIAESEASIRTIEERHITKAASF